MLENDINIAIIGLTTPSAGIEKLESAVVAEFAKYNAVIVSGLAIGCDTIAHKQAIKNNVSTIAILSSILKNIIPKENNELAKDIVLNGGLLISEYYQDARSKQEQIARFIKRDRLQAMFSDMVVLSASYSKKIR
ncbi:DNA-processing protein DprA [Campylobacter sp. faydin G-105]|nr:DNA-processing protein DprA [Campylobacter anatolicus]